MKSTFAWSPNTRSDRIAVETVRLREGVDLVLSRLDAADDRDFHFTEPEDVLGVGFHLKGGACFDMEGERFRTSPLDVWAGASPEGSRSSFTLPASGVQTASLRFSPLAIHEILDRHGLVDGALRDLARLSDQAVAVSRLSPLDADAARMVEAMFATPYVGAARSLFLESCALGLLASQIGAGDRSRGSTRAAIDQRRMEQARALLDARLDAPPSIMELARMVGVNDFKLKRDFKAAHGVTIFGYVRGRRMARAASALHDGLPVSAAAVAAGYECPRCFAEAFRRHFGVLPSEVSRQTLQKLPRGAYQAPGSP